MSGAVVIDFKYEEVFLVIFILFLWGLVLRIFFQRWGVYVFIIYIHKSYYRENKSILCLIFIYFESF